MSNEERYKRVLHLIDALCLNLDMKEDSYEGKIVGKIYQLAHITSGMCKSSVCQPNDELIEGVERELVAAKTISPWSEEIDFHPPDNDADVLASQAGEGEEK